MPWCVCKPCASIRSVCLALAFLDADAEPLFKQISLCILPISWLSALGTRTNIPLDFLVFLNVFRQGFVSVMIVRMFKGII